MKRWFLNLLFCAIASGDEVRVNDQGLIEAPGSDVRVFRGDAATPLFGSVSKERDIVRFAPALPFVPGENYRVEIQKNDGTWSTQRLRMELPKAEAPTAAMLHSDTSFPANALKFYLHFSQPMEQGVFLDRITLLRQDGSVVRGAFRETELWSPDGKRLTLWLHPGRQKTGVNLNTDEGPVLREGETYTLKLAANWRSAVGVELGKSCSFPITATAPDHQCPDPQRWKVAAPKRGTRDPLHLLFDEPLDPAMLYSALGVRSGDQAVKGMIHVATDARSWSLIPADEWPPGRYEIVIEPLLEDLAGNNLLGPFELDRDLPVQPAKLSLLKFEVR